MLFVKVKGDFLLFVQIYSTKSSSIISYAWIKGKESDTVKRGLYFA